MKNEKSKKIEKLKKMKKWNKIEFKKKIGKKSKNNQNFEHLFGSDLPLAIFHWIVNA